VKEVMYMYEERTRALTAHFPAIAPGRSKGGEPAGLCSALKNETILLLRITGPQIAWTV
jgi:hypothetical protein